MMAVVTAIIAAMFVLPAAGGAYGADKADIVVQAGHAAGVLSIAVSPDGKYVFSGDRDGTLKLWDIDTGREIRAFSGHSGDVLTVAISPDGKYAVSGGVDGTLK
ncbi:repeat-containing protein, partial [Candidatus Magnetobacterium bavaricum]